MRHTYQTLVTSKITKCICCNCTILPNFVRDYKKVGIKSQLHTNWSQCQCSFVNPLQQWTLRKCHNFFSYFNTHQTFLKKKYSMTKIILDRKCHMRFQKYFSHNVPLPLKNHSIHSQNRLCLKRFFKHPFHYFSTEYTKNE